MIVQIGELIYTWYASTGTWEFAGAGYSADSRDGGETGTGAKSRNAKIPYPIRVLILN